MTDLAALPDELVAMLDTSSMHAQPKGRLGCVHYRVILRDSTHAFLKFGEPARELQAEADRL